MGMDNIGQNKVAIGLHMPGTTCEKEVGNGTYNMTMGN